MALTMIAVQVMPNNDLTLKAAALKLGLVIADEFDRIVDPGKMMNPDVDTAA